MKLTINSGLTLQNTLKSRIADLVSLRNDVAVNESRSFYGEPKSETKKEANFDVKKVDTKIMQLKNMIFKLDSAIKQANAKTQLDMEGVDIDTLLAPLE